jgi:hypothetical protein
VQQADEELSMFNWLKGRKPSPPAGPDLREVLFGDVPLAEWAASGTDAPWDLFRTAAEALSRDDRGAAERALTAVNATPALESRQYAQAWTSLRALGITPPSADATRVFGVVLDVPVARGRDTLVAYEDGSARYLNFSGAAVVWDAPGADADVSARIAALLDAGRELALRIQPVTYPRPPLAPGIARISLLTPAGLRYGEGPFDALSRDALGAPIFGAGASLMQVLTRRARAS